MSYIHGWPHTSLTVAGTPARPASSLTTALAGDRPGTNSAANSTSGAVGTIYDGSNQETITCTAASTTAGPGTLTLASPVNYAHSAGIMVSALPTNVIWGASLFAAADALVRGATTTVVRNISGHAGGPSGADD